MKTALVIGSTGGLGKAITQKLVEKGVKVYGVGRKDNFQAGCIGVLADIGTEEGRDTISQALAEEGKLDILIHSAGVLLKSHDPADLDIQYNINFRAPYIVTRRFFPLLAAAQGQIVFVNSFAGLFVQRSELEQYAAMKHALRAFADSFRIEANEKGVRVLSLFPGRIATPLLKSLYEQEDRIYKPELLMQPESVADTIEFILSLPKTVEVTELTIRSTFSEDGRK